MRESGSGVKNRGSGCGWTFFYVLTSSRKTWTHTRYDQECGLCVGVVPDGQGYTEEDLKVTTVSRNSLLMPNIYSDYISL